MNSAKLEYGSNYLIVKDFEYHKQDEYYNTCFNLEVCSNGFCGVAPCEYDIKAFREFISTLCEMYDFRKQSASLNEICYGSTVLFESDRLGHISVSGEIYGYGMEHSLKFSFDADQFVLKQFIDELQKIIES